MEQPPEKRCGRKASLPYAGRVGLFQQAEKYSARMLNYSHTGACFESSQALINGATILVRLEDTGENAGRSATRMRSAHGRECSAWAKSNGAGIFRESAPSGSEWG